MPTPDPLDDYLTRVLDVTAQLSPSGELLRVQMGDRATANQPPRVERAIEEAGYTVARRRIWPRGGATYQIKDADSGEA